MTQAVSFLLDFYPVIVIVVFILYYAVPCDFGKREKETDSDGCAVLKMTEKENMRDRKRKSKERKGRRQDTSELRRQQERAGSNEGPDRLRDREQDSIEEQSSPGGGIAVQAGMLAAATIVVRIIGLLYRAPLTAIIGDEGNGYYGAAYNIYMIILILSSNSLPAAISRQMAAKIAVREYKNAQRAFHCAILYSLIVGAAGSLVLYFGAALLVPSNAVPVLRVFAPTVFLFGILGAVRGYFQANQSMSQTSVSQILEQILQFDETGIQLPDLIHRFRVWKFHFVTELGNRRQNTGQSPADRGKLLHIPGQEFRELKKRERFAGRRAVYNDPLIFSAQVQVPNLEERKKVLEPGDHITVTDRSNRRPDTAGQIGDGFVDGRILFPHQHIGIQFQQRKTGGKLFHMPSCSCLENISQIVRHISTDQKGVFPLRSTSDRMCCCHAGFTDAAFSCDD